MKEGREGLLTFNWCEVHTTAIEKRTLYASGRTVNRESVVTFLIITVELSNSC